MKWYVTYSSGVVVVVTAETESDAKQIAEDQFIGFGTVTNVEVI